MNTFTEHLSRDVQHQTARKLNPGECLSSTNRRCTLCFSSHIDYQTELSLKQRAVHEYWAGLAIPVPCNPLIASPLGRHYRIVSKRKAFLSGGRFSLGLIGVEHETLKNFPMDVGECAIEPASHALIYRIIQDLLQKKEQSNFTEDFNYVIVKGDEREVIVILNLNSFSPDNRKEINTLSKSLTAKAKNVIGVFVFVDEERSSYYLSGNPKKGPQGHPKPLMKIYGKDKLFHKQGETKFLYSPLSFTQTNHSIIDEFISTAKQLLNFNSSDFLLDLYCGYGLFALTLAPQVKRILGIELSRISIQDANENAIRNKLHNVRFVSADITPESLERYFQPHKENLKIIIDPPRNGTAEGVIELLSEFEPESVLHIFCNIDIIPKELQRWKSCGYMPTVVQPFDMFPGTDEIEMMILLKKK